MAIRSFLLLFLFSVQLIAQRSTFYEVVQYESKFEPTLQRDSFWIEYPGNWLNSSGAVIYQINEGNYIIGTNTFGDLAKAQHFVVNKPYFIHGAFFWIGALNGNAGQVHFDIWDYESKPAALIQRKTISVAQLNSMMLPADPTYIEFDTPVKVTKDYAIGIDLSDIGNTTLGLVSSRNGDGAMLDLAWEKWDNNEWYTILFGWNLDLDIAIFPFVSDEIDTSENPDFSGGKGTLQDPYLIANAEQLYNVRKYMSAHFRLTSDISLSDSQWSADRGWQPIGNIINCFAGSLDGNGHTISGLKINRRVSNYQGLFGCIQDGTIKNLKLSGLNIKGNQYTGGVTGYAKNSILEGVEVEGSITGDYYTGGIVGMLTGGTLSKSTVTARVSGTQYVGGGIGLINAGAMISGVSTMGSVEGDAIAGGLAGMVADESASVVSGPGGVVVVIPGNSKEDPSRLTLETGNPSEILRDGEILASPVIKVKLSGEDVISGGPVDGEGFPVYTVTFPITLENIEADRLRVRVRLREDTRLPVFGSYDPDSKTYSIQTFGLVQNWILGVISGEPVNSNISHSYSNLTKLDNEILLSSVSGFAVIDESGKVNAEGIKNNIIPTAINILEKYKDAGFGDPKLLPNVSTNEFMIHLIDKDIPGHNAVPLSSYYLSPRDINLLGGLYIYHPTYFSDVTNPSTWRIKDVLAHEMFHAIQYGYNFRVSNEISFGAKVSSSRFIEEGMASIMGPTYSDFTNFTESKFSLSKGEGNHNLGQSLDHFQWQPFSRQDFFGFSSKWLFNSEVTFFHPLLKHIASEAPSNKSDKGEQLLQLYRQGLDNFLKENGHNFPNLYLNYFMQRSFFHEKDFLLTNEELSDQIGFATKKLNKGMFGFPDIDLYYKDWKSSDSKQMKYEDILFDNISSNSGRCIVFYFPPELIDKPKTIQFNLSATGNHRFSSSLDTEGLKIAYIRAINDDGSPYQDENPIFIEDINQPLQIAIEKDISHIVFFIIYPSISENQIKVNISTRSIGKVLNLTKNIEYLTIQQAINEASVNDEISVGPGVYNEAVRITKGLNLYSESGANQTIIDGTGFKNKVGVSIVHGLSSILILNGFTIQNWDECGIEIRNSRANISNNVIANIRAAERITWGGGINIEAGSTNLIGNVIIDNSNKYYGGGVAVHGGQHTIQGNILKNNHNTDWDGAGIYLNGNFTEIKVLGNIIDQNTGRNGSGIYCDGASNILIEQNEVLNNSASNSGAGIYLRKSNNVIVKNNKIKYNTALLDGGGIAVDECNPQIIDNIIFGNISQQGGGGIWIRYSADVQKIPFISSNTISQNFAEGYGGGVYGVASNWKMFESIIINNIPVSVRRHKAPWDEISNMYSGNNTGQQFSCTDQNGNIHNDCGKDVFMWVPYSF
jgi:parallel beta-helix repeat protein